MGHDLQGLRFKEMRPFRRDMQIVFQDPYGSLSPRMSVADIIKEGLKVHQPDMSDRERDERVVQALATTSASTPSCAFAFPMNFPAASASASRWRAPWCWSRASSCSTSRPARSTW